ncbi:MAG: helix-turn-helix transcriptional regulator [Candidatus Thorarchaeota archaeon]
MKRIVISMVFVTLVVCTIIPVSGQYYLAQDETLSFDPIDIHIILFENGTSSLMLNARISNLGINPVSDVRVRFESLDLILNRVVVDLEITDGLVQQFERYSEITIFLPDELASGSSVWIAMELTVQDLQSNVGLSTDGSAELWHFIYYVRPFSVYRNFTLTVFLPTSSALSPDSVTPLFPEPIGNFTDGQSLAFTWNTSILQPGQEKVFIAKYQTSINSAPTSFLIFEIILVGILGLALGIFFGVFGKRIVQRIRSIGSIKIIGVTSEEEEVLEVLRTKGGSCLQKDLYVSMDMSQSKVSLILTNLEERGLVRRLRDGRENTVHLCED